MNIPETSVPQSNRRSGFSVTAIAMPFLGTLVCSVILAQRNREMAWGIAGAAPLIIGGGIGSAFGVLLAVCAAFRDERPLLVVLAFLLCLPLAALFLILRFA
jgi:hypothetical protein